MEDELYSGCSQEQFSDGSTYQQIKLNGSKEALIQAQFPELSHSWEQECGQGDGIVMYRRRWFRNKWMRKEKLLGSWLKDGKVVTSSH